MKVPSNSRNIHAVTLSLVVATLLLTSLSSAQDMHTTTTFSGVKVNGGTVLHARQNGKNVLTLSDDFKVPETPDPHWQVVDSLGQVYLLDRLQAKDGKYRPPAVIDLSHNRGNQAFARIDEAVLANRHLAGPSIH